MIFTVMLALICVVAILVGAIRFAQARGGDPSSSSDQSRRILLPAFVFTFGLAAYSLLAELGWARVDFIVMTTATIIVINGVGSLVLISATDLAAKAMGARRTRAWLIAGIAVFAGAGALALLTANGAFSGRGLAALLEPDLVALTMLAAAAAFIWWAHLPADTPDASIFE